MPGTTSRGRRVRDVYIVFAKKLLKNQEEKTSSSTPLIDQTILPLSDFSGHLAVTDGA